MIYNLGHFNFSLESLQQLWGGWAYLLLALLVAIEGPITTLAAAVAASTGLLNPVLVFIFASLGNLTADTLWYGLGYMGKTEWILHYGSWLGIKESFLTRLQKDIHAHIHKVLFVAKLTLGFVIPTLIAAGLARVPFKRWFGVLFAGECLWTGGLVLVGYYFGYLFQRIENNLRWITLGGMAIFIILVILYLIHRKSDLESEL
jgi:membrane protein DedA with SNARE-associated domain